MIWLKQAVAAGYKDLDHMKMDKDLDALRDRKAGITLRVMSFLTRSVRTTIHGLRRGFSRQAR